VDSHVFMFYRSAFYQPRKVDSIYVLGVSICLFLLFSIGTVPTVWYFSCYYLRRFATSFITHVVHLFVCCVYFFHTLVSCVQLSS
jgi:hypothetical protein